MKTSLTLLIFILCFYSCNKKKEIKEVSFIQLSKNINTTKKEFNWHQKIINYKNAIVLFASEGKDSSKLLREVFIINKDTNETSFYIKANSEEVGLLKYNSKKKIKLGNNKYTEIRKYDCIFRESSINIIFYWNDKLGLISSKSPSFKLLLKDNGLEGDLKEIETIDKEFLELIRTGW